MELIIIYLILNELGERIDKPVTICIDALNESGNKGIWRTDLPSLVQAVQKMPYVKLIVSYRSGYERLVLGDAVRDWLKTDRIAALHHDGFRDEGPEAVQDFLNHYSIPFSPEYYLQYEMANPLFLTLFCETYDGSLVDIETIIDRIIDKADQDVQNSIGLDGNTQLLKHLLKEFAKKRIASNRHGVKKEDVLKLQFWDLYGISQIKLSYLTGLCRFGIISEYAIQDDEYYSISYNLFEDYICAKAILKQDRTKEETIKYIGETILGVSNEEINHFNIGLFIATCSLFPEKYNEECTCLFSDIKDEYDRVRLKEEYIRAFSWRKVSGIDPNSFLNFIDTNSIPTRTVFSLLLECSAKCNHPLNARFLHKLLYEMALPQRDSLWSIFINELNSDEHRIVNLVLFLDKGGIIDTINEEASLLLAITFTWMLSSSNRFLRDKTSKALVELLKHRFNLSLKLLSLFDGVNDPYIVQRLYGVIFGACMKRKTECKTDFDALAQFVYHHVFCCEQVYPDILMRDFARLIVERYAYEYPEDAFHFDLSCIRPPYKSQEIPSVEREALSEEYGSGIAQIERSMSPNYRGCGPVLYGDFGRYVFEASVSAFKNVDIPNLYHYALRFIKKDLGYSDELFSAYDSSPKNSFRSRNDAKKIERIGKKYEWIAYYNILARLSDTHLIHEWDRDSCFDGPWEPYVRDFDPTLNIIGTIPPDIPNLRVLQIEEIKKADFIASDSDDVSADEWSKKPCCYFSTLINDIIASDDQGKQWIVLHQHSNIQSETDMLDDRSIGFKKGSQYIWLSIDAFFAPSCDANKIREYSKKATLRKIALNGQSNSQLYNREYFWAPSVQTIIQDGWAEIELPTNKTKQIVVGDSKDDPLRGILDLYGYADQDYKATDREPVCRAY